MAYVWVVTTKDQQMGIKPTSEISYIRKIYTSDNEHAVSAKETVTYGFEFLDKCLSVTNIDKQ